MMNLNYHKKTKYKKQKRRNIVATVPSWGYRDMIWNEISLSLSKREDYQAKSYISCNQELKFKKPLTRL